MCIYRETDIFYPVEYLVHVLTGKQVQGGIGRARERLMRQWGVRRRRRGVTMWERKQ